MWKPHAARPAAIEVIRDEELSTVCGGRASSSELQVTKRVDTASSKLFLACANGTHIPEVQI